MFALADEINIKSRKSIEQPLSEIDTYFGIHC